MSIFFSSDHHFYHTNILKFCPERPYKTVEEMNEKLVENWNNVVKPEDEVWYLGDFSMAIKPVETISTRLNGKKHLIPGNHDWCHSSHKKSNNEEKKKAIIAFYESFGWKVWDEQTYLDTESGELFVLCHLPYKDGDLGIHSESRRYSSMYPEDTGTILLCGHVHQNWKTKVSSKGTLMINVGIDVHDMRPVSLEEILKIKNIAHIGK